MRSSTLRRRASLGTAALALGVGLSALAAHPAAAQTVVYDNTKTFLGQGDTNGIQAGATTTYLEADDITPITGFAGRAVTGFTFSTANFNAAATTFTPTVYFYSNSATNTPGTLLGAFVFNPITQGAGSVFTRSATSAAGFFALPASTFWAGISFSGATSAELANLGQGLFSPPAIGSSQNIAFASDGPATTASNPVGGTFNFGTGGPAANFGWSFTVAPAPAPEASTTVSLGLLLALGMGGLVIASKRKKASAQA